MIVNLNPTFQSVRGRLGNMVFYRRMGTQCARAYLIPGNPDTVAQREVRGRFSSAVRAWQRLDETEKLEWCRNAARRRMRGYNLFISNYMKANAVDAPSAAPALPAPLLNRNIYGSSSVLLRFPSVAATYLLQSRSYAPPETRHVRLE